MNLSLHEHGDSEAAETLRKDKPNQCAGPGSLCQEVAQIGYQAFEQAHSSPFPEIMVMIRAKNIISLVTYRDGRFRADGTPVADPQRVFSDGRSVAQAVATNLAKTAK